MNILGLSAFYHDSAAALLRDGVLVAAAQEERFTRLKHDARFPLNAVRFCMQYGGLELKDLDMVVFYDQPKAKFERLLETYLAFAPKGFSTFSRSLPVWLGSKLNQEALIRQGMVDAYGDGLRCAIEFVEHHMSHAASAFYPSPFEEAVVLCLDGVGEWATTSVSMGSGSELRMIKEITFPHSLGLLYSAFTYYTGFKVNSGEYKVMGLAPYGEPRYAQTILDTLIDVRDDGSFWLNQDYFSYCIDQTMVNARFEDLFGVPPRSPEAPLEQVHMDLAASVQAVTEHVVLTLTSALAHETRQRNLCMAGGVALNCVANGKILRAGSFENLWIQPAAGDAGGAVGAAWLGHVRAGGKRVRPSSGGDGMAGAYLGPCFSQQSIEAQLTAVGARFTILEPDAVIDTAARTLAEGGAVGWFQGRMEFGPRALGNRSILGDPRSPTMQKLLNLKVKHRESFRPFAPSILRERVADWFELDGDSPYMLIVADVIDTRRRAMTEKERALFGIDKLNVPRSDIPAVTHVDYSARIQTVHEATNPRYHALIRRFDQLTGCPVLVNTSFNVRSEPIVCTPNDAFRCFMGTGIELLVVGDCILRKVDQDPTLLLDYKNSFELD
jgi:carbamoyltransferase